MPSGLISTSSRSRGFIRMALVSGVNGVVERPWKDEDQSIVLPSPLPLVVNVGNVLPGVRVGDEVVVEWRSGSITEAGGIAAWGSMYGSVGCSEGRRISGGVTRVAGADVIEALPNEALWDKGSKFRDGIIRMVWRSEWD